MPTVLCSISLPTSSLRLTLDSRRELAIGLDDALGQRQHHRQRMLGDGMGVAAGLVDDQHAGIGAGLDVDRIESRAVAGDEQQVRRALQEGSIDMEMRGQFVTGGADLVDMSRFDDRREIFLRALVLDAIEPDIGPRLQNVDIDRVGQIFDVEDALAVDGHQDPSGFLQEIRRASAARDPFMRSSVLLLLPLMTRRHRPRQVVRRRSRCSPDMLTIPLPASSSADRRDGQDDGHDKGKRPRSMRGRRENAMPIAAATNLVRGGADLQ